MTVSNESTSATNQSAQAVFRVMAATCSEHLPRCIRELIKGGEIDALRAALDSGIVRAISEKAETQKPFQSIAAEMAAAVNDLAMQRQDDPRVTELVSDWRSAAGSETDEKLALRLCHAKAIGTTRSLLGLGADPTTAAPEMLNDDNWSPGVTVLGYLLRVHTLNTAVVREVMEHLADQGKFPVVERTENGTEETFYDWALDSSKCPSSDVATAMLDGQAERGVPETWSAAAGRALLRRVETGKLFDEDADLRVLELRTMQLASFEQPKDWVRVLAFAEWDMLVPNLLARTEMPQDIALTILEKLTQAGIHPDELGLAEEDEIKDTWLQQAVDHCNVGLTKKLLESGADPYVRCPVYIMGKVVGSRNTFEIADTHISDSQEGKNEMLSLLAAWKARSAVEQVLAQHNQRDGVATLSGGR